MNTRQVCPICNQDCGPVVLSTRPVVVTHLYCSASLCGEAQANVRGKKKLDGIGKFLASIRDTPADYWPKDI